MACGAFDNQKGACYVKNKSGLETGHQTDIEHQTDTVHPTDTGERDGLDVFLQTGRLSEARKICKRMRTMDGIRPATNVPGKHLCWHTFIKNPLFLVYKTPRFVYSSLCAHVLLQRLVTIESEKMKRARAEYDGLLKECKKARGKLARLEKALKETPYALRQQLTPWLAKELIDTGRLTQMCVVYNKRVDSHLVAAGYYAEIHHEELNIEITMDDESVCVKFWKRTGDYCWEDDLPEHKELDPEEDSPPKSSRLMWEAACKDFKSSSHALALAVFWCFCHNFDPNDAPIRTRYEEKEEGKQRQEGEV